MRLLPCDILLRLPGARRSTATMPSRAVPRSLTMPACHGEQPFPSLSLREPPLRSGFPLRHARHTGRSPFPALLHCRVTPLLLCRKVGGSLRLRCYGTAPEAHPRPLGAKPVRTNGRRRRVGPLNAPPSTPPVSTPSHYKEQAITVRHAACLARWSQYRAGSSRPSAVF